MSIFLKEKNKISKPEPEFVEPDEPAQQQVATQEQVTTQAGKQLRIVYRHFRDRTIVETTPGNPVPTLRHLKDQRYYRSGARKSNWAPMTKGGMTEALVFLCNPDEKKNDYRNSIVVGVGRCNDVDTFSYEQGRREARADALRQLDGLFVTS